MAYEAKILLDSRSPEGVRLTTFEVTIPRIVLAEFNTHRMLSRNSASSRAIPVEKMLQRVKDDPFIPIHWGKNQKGMQADEELTPALQAHVKAEWLEARDLAIEKVEKLLAIGVHKQITNRLLEPWLWHTIIVTATEWRNLWGLRLGAEAQPEIRRGVEMMKAAYDASVPLPLKRNEWHLPLVNDRDQLVNGGFTLGEIVEISVGRCARVSYLTHNGRRDPLADLELAQRLLRSGHMSPFEHVARPMDATERAKDGFCGNLRGWVQARKHVKDEHDFSLVQGTDAHRTLDIYHRL